jgi:hypothetical protein
VLGQLGSARPASKAMQEDFVWSERLLIGMWNVSGQGDFPVKIPAPYNRFRGLAYRCVVVRPPKLDEPSLATPVAIEDILSI